MGEKRQICFLINEKDAKKMEKIREETGVSVSEQVALALKGYEIKKKS